MHPCEDGTEAGWNLILIGLCLLALVMYSCGKTDGKKDCQQQLIVEAINDGQTN